MMEIIEQYNQFCEEAFLNKKHSPYMKRRAPGEYGYFLIVKCRSDWWWYKNFVGLEFFGRIEKETYREHEVFAVRLTQTKMIVGRSIPINDLILL